MPASTVKEREQERAHALEMLARNLPDDGRAIYTLTTYGRGETDYVRVFTLDPGDAGQRPYIAELTFYVGKVTGRRITDKGLALGGGGYSKGLDVFIDALQAVGQTPDQSRWEEL